MLPDYIIKTFWKFVKKQESCWLWIGLMTPKGYGRFLFGNTNNRKEYLAHRVSYIIHKGDILDNFDVHHDCRNRRCVNPEHLFAKPHGRHGERLIRHGAVL